MYSYLYDCWTRLLAKCIRMHRSWVIRFNAFGAAIITGLPYLQDQWPQLQGLINDRFYHTALTIIILGNMVLRFKTSKPLEQK